jgi:hypothetical protein
MQYPEIFPNRIAAVLFATVSLSAVLGTSLSAQVSPQTPYVSTETLILDGKAMPLGAQQASDTSLNYVGGQWVAAITTVGWNAGCAAENSSEYVIRQTAATLPSGANLASAPASWQVSQNGQGGYAQWIVSGPGASWDHDAIEAPKIVTGYNTTLRTMVTRMYYTGWRRIQTGTDGYGCPVYGYQDWKIGMAEWSPSTNQWVKHSTPVLQGSNLWELMHYFNANGTYVTYCILGDQTVIYVPGSQGGPGTWHMYYQAMSDYPAYQEVTVHATSSDGINWPASQRKILQTHPPSPNAMLPSGPYSIDVAYLNGRYYFVGWVPNADPLQQGIWLTSSSTPDGSAEGDFSKWVPLIYDANGTWWHSADPQTLESHTAGLVAPTLVEDTNGTYWLYYNGVRLDSDGLWTSIGRVQVNASALQ